MSLRDNLCVCFTVACRVLSLAGNLRQRNLATPRQRTNPAEPFYRVPLGRFLKGRPYTCAARCSIGLLKKHFLETSPLRNDRRFWQSVAHENQASCRHGFLLHTVTRLLRPRLPHYYGIICHLTPRRPLLELPLEASLPIPSAVADCRMMPGFPSYCANSLLMITPSTTCCRCSCIGHHVFLHTRPDNRPNQVHLRYVPSTSYRFLQTPPLASDTFANQIPASR